MLQNRWLRCRILNVNACLHRLHQQRPFINHQASTNLNPSSLTACWVELNGRHGSAPPPVVQRQDGDGENAADPVGVVGLVDRPCINVQLVFRLLHIAYPVVGSPEVSATPLFYQWAQEVAVIPYSLPIHILSRRVIAIQSDADASFRRSHGSSFHYRCLLCPVPSVTRPFNFSFDSPHFPFLHRRS